MTRGLSGDDTYLVNWAAARTIGIAAALLLVTAAAWAQRPYYLSDLGSMGGLVSQARSISEHADVAGWAMVDQDPLAVLYEPAGPVSLGTLAGYTQSYAYGMNASGRIVGSCGNEGSTSTAAMYYGGSWSNLGSLGGAFACAEAINTTGQAVGNAGFDPANPAARRAFRITPADTDGDGHGDLWYRDANADGLNDLMQDLGTLGGTSSSAQSINDAGDVVGSSSTSGLTHAFLYRRSAMVDIGSLHGQPSYATDINSAGRVVGYTLCTDEGAPGLRGFVFEDVDDDLQADHGELSLLPQGAGEDVAFAINDAGVVVGRTTIDGYMERACVWSDGGAFNLNDLIPTDSEMILYEARDINNAGQIVGTGVSLVDFNNHAFLLTPAHFGDATGDGLVDVGDLGVMAINWGLSGCGWRQADYTGDGVVDVGDLGVLAMNWGWTRSAAPPAAQGADVPEPGTLLLLCLAAVWRRARARPTATGLV